MKHCCYDCKTNVTDYVMESRCTGGDSHTLYPQRYYSTVPVCSDRRVCKANQEKRQAAIEYTRKCPVCDEKITFTDATESVKVHEHLATHSKESLIVALTGITGPKWTYGHQSKSE